MFSPRLAFNRSLPLISLCGALFASATALAGGGGRTGWLIPAQPAAPVALGAPIGYIPTYPVYAPPKHQLWQKPKFLAAPVYAPAPVVGYWQPAPTAAAAPAPSAGSWQPAPTSGYWQAAPAPAAAAPSQPVAAAAPGAGESSPSSPPSDYVSNGTWYSKLFVYWNGKEYVSRSWSSSGWSGSAAGTSSGAAASPNGAVGAAPSESKRGRLSAAQQGDLYDSLKKRRGFLEDAETPKDEVRNALQAYAEGAYQEKTNTAPENFNSEDKAAITDLVDSAIGSSDSSSKTESKAAGTADTRQPDNRSGASPQPAGYYYYYAAPAPSHHHGHGYRPGYMYGYPY
ncbi:MAG: hypothetical protein SFX72_12410 [Isosphaeraceae bacterium]|nr:hypothetical protein [Isosphaeraceae bacterium]